MKLIILIGSILTAFSSQAYETGTYHCKNSNPNLPDSVYEIKDVDVAGDPLPYLKAKRYSLDRTTDQVRESVVRGIAMVSTINNSEILNLNQFRIEFVNGKFVNCKTE